jgi:hypothetical protein
MKVEAFDIWQSSISETSIFSNIPIDLLQDFKSSRFHDPSRMRIVYRGPRKIDPHSTRKSEATAFSVYIK